MVIHAFATCVYHPFMAKKMIHVRVSDRSEVALKAFCSQNRVTVTEAVRQALNVAYANRSDWLERIRLAQDEQFGVTPPTSPPGEPFADDRKAPW